MDIVWEFREFNRFYTRVMGLLNRHIYDSALSLSEVRVLYELRAREGCTAKALCEELGIDRGYMSRMLAKFEQKGWLRREMDPADRRSAVLWLTEAGAAQFGTLDRAAAEQIQALVGNLSAEEQAALVRAMRTIRGTMEEEAV